MNLMEKKMNAVMRFIAAGNGGDQERARKEIRELMNCTAPPASENPEQAVRRILLELGVPENIKGHSCLVAAICIAIRNPDSLEAITKELYPAVAKEFQDTPSRVERAIRHAIENAWGRCDYDVLRHYFGNTVSPTKGKPTNSEFIARISNMVRQHGA